MPSDAIRQVAEEENDEVWELAVKTVGGGASAGTSSQKTSAAVRLLLIVDPSLGQPQAPPRPD